MSSDFEAVKQVKREREDSLLALPNVTGVGIGYKRVGGEETDELAVVVSVERKLSRDELDSAAAVPERLESAAGEVVTDVIQVGPMVARARQRPIFAGSEIGGGLPPRDFTRFSGTLGGFVADGRTVYLLSNNHVLCDPKSQQKRYNVLQPLDTSAYRVADQVGKVVGTFEMKAGGQVWADAAIATVLTPEVDARYPNAGKLAGHHTRLGLRWEVMKYGATSGGTWGNVVNLDYKAGLQVPGVGKVTLPNQVLIQGAREGTGAPVPIFRSGDSGSIWVTQRDRYAAALGFGSPNTGNPAEDDNWSVATPIHMVIEGFRNALSLQRLGMWSGGKGAGMLEATTAPDGVFGDEPEAIERLVESFVSLDESPAASG
jgi:hypothetical protein